ncbi:membrane protein [Pseudomonas oryzihabitans]|nr:membrane protein [Pseudomonas psychrotolerans]KTT41110.1 membrane protein [Pseudomonas psychrotolerans]KTT46086.1 membrane protein [Pseudomonas psychrotolerans]KTT64450.1 membrane protein [Pseudomonas psychrotolerans]
MLYAYLGGFSAFLLYLLLALAMLGLFCVLYAWLTPHREWQLIRANVPAAALAFGGSLLGFVLPLAGAMRVAVSLVDFLIWAVIALVTQLLAFQLLRLGLPGLPQRLAANEMASGILAACFALAVGVLNAAAITG